MVTYDCEIMIDCFLRHFQQYFSYIMATCFSGESSRKYRREPPTLGKQLVNLITLQSRTWTHAVLVIELYELLGNPTT
jgi:hypothetical protein